MKCLSAFCMLSAATGLLLSTVRSEAANWPGWRGPEGTGISPESSAPTEWGPDKNVRWRVALPEPGNSSPVVWGDRVFVTQSVEGEKRRELMCFDRQQGKLQWKNGTVYPEEERSHRRNPYASASPVTDGERVIAWFGSAGLFCYDMEGDEVWARDLGKQDHEWGYGASPILYGDLCILHFGPGERTFLLAVNKKTGEDVWRVEFPEQKFEDRTDGFKGDANGVVGSWSTPIVMETGGREELVLSIPGQVVAFDPGTGKELWHCEGLNPLLYTSPIHGDGVVVAMGGFRGTTVAVRAGGNGDVTESHKLWEDRETKNRLGSGVVHEGYVYILNTDGIAQCLDLETGKEAWSERLRGAGPTSESWSSMVMCGGINYILNQSGDTILFKAEPEFELVGINSLGGEMSNSSLAVSDGDIFIRTHEHLWCVSEGN